jgi:hypothetical protein
VGLTEMMDAGEQLPTRRRRRRWLGCLPLVLLLVAGVLVGLYLSGQRNLLPLPVSEGCVAHTPDGIVDLDVGQMGNAGTIAAVTVSRNLPEWAATVALATAMQESQLVNLSGGDRDSVGLFQQRPSQGWGAASLIEDPVYATDKFLDRLVAIPGYAELPLTVAAQDVQHSGYPDAYAQHESDAKVLSGALTGRIASGVTCQVNGVGTASSAADGTSAVVTRLGKEFGQVAQPRLLPLPPVPASGSASGSGSASASAGAATEAQLAVSTRAGLTGSTQRGWAVAAWAVAHCQDLHISAVRYAGSQWTAADSTEGWRSVAPTSPSASTSASPSAAPARADADVSASQVLITVSAE